jgi:DNA topoisomerase VI subunit A
VISIVVGAVVASEKGVVVGRLTYREDGDLIDCRRMGVGGKAIPPNVDKVRLFYYKLHSHQLP